MELDPQLSVQHNLEYAILIYQSLFFNTVVSIRSRLINISYNNEDFD